MARRIDSLIEGEEVTLLFHGSRSLGNGPYTDTVIFEGIVGEGEDRRAVFGDFELYRFRGRWSYGTSAEKASLLS